MNHHHHPSGDHPHGAHQQSDGSDHQRFLDLDAEVFGANLAAVLDSAGLPTPRTVVDLGAGTGTGSRLLRARYPDASVTCVDNDSQMLDVLRQQGFAVVQADLDDGFPALPDAVRSGPAAAPLDLVWASSSLHHVAHPARLLSGVRRALAPTGAMLVVELADFPLFLRDPDGALVEQRCHAAAAAEGWNHYPDWSPFIEAEGFTVARTEVTTLAPVTPAAREYAQQWWARFAHLETLSEDDRDAIVALLQGFSDHTKLEPRTTRTVWVATPRGPQP